MNLLLSDPNQLQCDTIQFTYTDSTHTTITYKKGGTSGVTVLVMTITYTDSTQANVASVVRTQPTTP